jgi:hypothetical protein
VVERVQEILGVASGEAVSERATLSREGSTLTLVLSAADGRLLGKRQLVAESDCETLAAAAAVVLATWLSDVHPEFVAPLPESPGLELEPKARAAAPSAGTKERAPAKPARDRPAISSPPVRRFSSEVGLGVSLAGGQPAPVASFALSWSPPASSGWGLSLALEPQGTRRVSLGTGEAVWSRWPVALGPLVRFASARSVFDVSAAAAVGWLRMEGQGFSPARDQSDFTTGALARIQLAGAPGVFEPFGSAQLLYWLKRAEVYTSPRGSSAELPSLELTFLVGVRIRP